MTDRWLSGTCPGALVKKELSKSFLKAKVDLIIRICLQKK